jgi:hypothetical protein
VQAPAFDLRGNTRHFEKTVRAAMSASRARSAKVDTGFAHAIKLAQMA